MQAEKDAGPVREEEQVGSWYSNPVGKPSAPGPHGTGVGRYLKLPAQPGGQAAGEAAPPPAKKPKQAQYGDFSGW